MKLSPQDQVISLQLAEAQSLLDGLKARGNVLPERKALDELRARRVKQTRTAARSKLHARDLEMDIQRLKSDIAKMHKREKAARASLGAAEDKNTRRDLQHDMDSSQRRRKLLEKELQQFERMRQAQGINSEMNAKEEVDEQLRAAELRLADAERDVEIRHAAAESKIEMLREKLSAAALKHYDKLAATNGIAVARIDGRTCGSCFMELDVGTIHEFRGLPADDVSYCPDCGAMLVREATIAAAKGNS